MLCCTVQAEGTFDEKGPEVALMALSFQAYSRQFRKTGASSHFYGESYSLKPISTSAPLSRLPPGQYIIYWLSMYRVDFQFT